MTAPAKFVLKKRALLIDVPAEQVSLLPVGYCLQQAPSKPTNPAAHGVGARALRRKVAKIKREPAHSQQETPATPPSVAGAKHPTSRSNS